MLDSVKGCNLKEVLGERDDYINLSMTDMMQLSKWYHVASIQEYIYENRNITVEEALKYAHQVYNYMQDKENVSEDEAIEHILGGNE